jgi:carbamoylphosphate synthase small subunit
LVIGLSQRILYHKGRAHDSIEHGWYSYLRGHTLFYLPNSLAQDFERTADQLDSFIITGGDDNTLRKVVETKLATEMMKRNKPVVGVCHGAFMLTDLLGGKVFEDLDAHQGCNHPVMYFGDVHIVNSYHNLGIASVHSQGTVLCTDELGHVESWIDGNLAGIVWHPERMNNPWIPEEIENLIKVKNER